MPVRYRSMGPLYYSGTSTYFGNVSQRTNAYLHKSSEDVLGNSQGDNMFRITAYGDNQAVMNGQNSSGTRKAESLPFYTTLPTHSGFSGVDSDSMLATRLAAGSNPSTPHVNLPLTLFEFKDLPRMVKLAGDSLLTGASNANLAWQFGWAPLISDVSRLLNFADAAQRRLDMFTNLGLKGGYRVNRTLFTDEDETVEDSSFTIESLVGIVRCKKILRRTHKVWGSMRWVPEHDMIPQLESQRLALANQVVLGLHHGQAVSTVWNAIPWSWLIDWFVNVDDFLKASNNSFATPASTICIMEHQRIERRYEIFSKPSWLSVSSDPVVYRETKRRDVVSPLNLTAKIPFLTGRQLSILGSLAVLKRGWSS